MEGASGGEGQKGERVLQPLWDFVFSHPDIESVCSHWLFPSVVGLTSFFLICMYFTIFYDIPKNMKSKVQKEAWHSNWDILKMAVSQMLAYVILNYASWVVWPKRVPLPREAPTVLQFCVEFFVSVMAGDFLIYWEHRIMHMVPWLRNNIHYVHHMYSAPYSWAGGWVHPLEDLVAIWTQVVTPTTLSFHPLSYWVFLFFWVIHLVDEHSGHDTWFALYHWLPFQWGGGGAVHDLHHHPCVRKNFGFLLTIWDQMFGTFVPADFLEKEREKEKDKERMNATAGEEMKPSDMKEKQGRSRKAVVDRNEYFAAYSQASTVSSPSGDETGGSNSD